MLAIFDEWEQQMPELQGPYTKVVERLREHDLTGAEIIVADSISGGGIVTPEEFFNIQVRPRDDESIT